MKKILALTCLVLLCGSPAVSAELYDDERTNYTAPEKFTEKERYDIYFEVNSGIVNVVEDAQINNVISINGKRFIEYSKDTFGKFTKDIYGYIDFHSVKAIHPQGVSVKVIEADGGESRK